MNDEIIIEFSRSKDDAKKIFFNKLWLRQIIPNIILGLILLPASYMLGLILGVSINLGLGLEGSSNNFFPILMTIVILNFFFAPVYKLYFLYKKQINEIYSKNKVLYNIFRINEDRFKYENETLSIGALWSNTTMLKIDNDFFQFQTIVPNIYFWIPTSQLSFEAKNILIKKISKSKSYFKGFNRNPKQFNDLY
jgi:hypothetical protein